MGIRAKDTDYAWAAGFIEADGCSHLTVTGNCRASVIVVQRDKSALERVQRIFDTDYAIHVVTRGPRQYWRWTASGAKAEAVLLKILPYLEYKRSQAERALALLARRRLFPGKRGHGVKLSPDELAARLAIVHAERLSEQAPAVLAG